MSSLKKQLSLIDKTSFFRFLRYNAHTSPLEQQDLTILSIIYAVQYMAEHQTCQGDETSFSSPNGKIPHVSLYDYVWKRLVHYLGLPPTCFLLASILIDRLFQNRQTFLPYITISMSSVHRLFVTALVVSQKYLFDKSYTNVYYAKVAGLPVHEFNQLERLFLLCIDYSIYTTEEQLIEYIKPINVIYQSS